MGFTADNLPVNRHRVVKTSIFPFEAERKDVEALRKKARTEIDSFIQSLLNKGAAILDFEKKQLETALKIQTLLKSMNIIT